jgi:hypothetical protein
MGYHPVGFLLQDRKPAEWEALDVTNASASNGTLIQQWSEKGDGSSSGISCLESVPDCLSSNRPEKR